MNSRLLLELRNKSRRCQDGIGDTRAPRGRRSGKSPAPRCPKPRSTARADAPGAPSRPKARSLRLCTAAVARLVFAENRVQHRSAGAQRQSAGIETRE